jgi:serine/threonine protein kinase
MGVVYKAFDLVVERRVALKTICVSAVGDTDFLDILRREAKAVGRFEHPNIVTLFDAGEIEGMFCMVMQLVEGESLRDRLQRQRWFKPTLVIDIFCQILAGLGYAHERGIVHRDIKPANIMMGADGIIKLADFGIAKLIGPHASSSGLVIGTPSYMSPEQVLGRPVDARSDTFSVGCTLYEVLTGEKAYPGETASGVMYKIVHESPTRPAKLRPDTHQGLEAVALKALANDPENRYANCGEMAAALLACLNKQTAVPGTSLERNGAESAPDLSSARSSGTKWMEGRRLTIFVAEAMILIVAILLVTLVAHKRTGYTPPTAQPPTSITREAAVPINSKPPPATKPVETVKKPYTPNTTRPKYQSNSIDLRPTRPAPAASDFTSMLLRGDTAFQQSDYEGALSAYLKADALKPGDPGVRRKLKVSLTLLGRVADAQAYK